MPAELISSKVRFREVPPARRTLPGAPTSIAALLGITEKGPLVAQLVRDFKQYLRLFGGYIAEGDLTHAVAGFFENGGREVWIARTMHFTDITDLATAAGVKSTGNLATPGAETPATITGSQAGPFVFDPGFTLVVDVDGAGDLTATFDAVQGVLVSANAETYALSNGETLDIVVDSGLTQTITFLTADFVAIGVATALEVAAKINIVLTGGSARDSGGSVDLRSDVFGTASAIQVTGGTANVALGFSTTAVPGTGDVANIKAVSVAEVETVAEADIAGLVVVAGAGGVVELQTTTTGLAVTLEVDGSSTAAAALGLTVDTEETGSDSGSANAILVEGKYLGGYGDNLTIDVRDATSSVATEFNLVVTRDGRTLETFHNLDPDPLGARYFETVVNADKTGSALITLTDLSLPSNPRPQTQLLALSGGDDGLSALADTDFVGSAIGKTGFHALDTVNDDLLLAAPDRPTAVVHNAGLAYIETSRDGKGLFIMDSPADMDAAAIDTYVNTTAGLTGSSEFGAFYWPQALITNPDPGLFGTSPTIVVPPSGMIAGMIARTDASRSGGVYEPPAGPEKGILIGMVGLESDEALEEGKRDIVANRNINPLNKRTATSFYVDGVDVLKTDFNFPTVSERRGVNFITSTAKTGLEVYRFRNNDTRLRAEVDRTLVSFLTEQMNNGAFRTTDPETAFLVDVSDDPDDIFANQLVVHMSLATQKPAKFIDVTLTQDVRGLQ